MDRAADVMSKMDASEVSRAATQAQNYFAGQQTLDLNGAEQLKVGSVGTTQWNFSTHPRTQRGALSHL